MEVASANDLFEADHAARLVGRLRRAIEDRACCDVGIERLALNDAERCQHAAPVGVGKVRPLAVDQRLELIESARVAA